MTDRMAAAFDILVAGEINPDLILSDPELEPRFGQVEALVQDAALTIGSSSAIFACGAARLGLRVAFIGVAGDDFFGRFMLEAMEGRGVNTSAVIIDPAQKTGLSVILSRIHDRAILTHAGAIAALQAEMVPDALLRQARHLHVASYFLQTALQPGLPDLFRRARKLGLSTSLDTNWDPAEAWAGVLQVLAFTSVFLPNAAEACSLARLAEPAAAAQHLAEQAEVVAVKLGAQGALACRVGELYQAEAVPAQVVDTVGAGDSFDAGFLYGYLHGWTLDQSLRLGCACGALSTQKAGGVNGQPTLEQALDALGMGA